MRVKNDVTFLMNIPWNDKMRSISLNDAERVKGFAIPSEATLGKRKGQYGD